ncbi:MAG: LPS export ABC transporter permease LptG [Gammaproteobacteria bacterium]|nr:LPS export ABC transporter permease LptG [Gammaproteobacteria bacterium]
MKTLDLYIHRTVFKSTLIVLMVFGALFAFMTFVSQIDHIGKNDYTLVNALMFVALTLPRSLYDLFPTATLIGGLLGLGALAGNSELIVMRAAGISIRRITRSVLQSGLVLTVLVAAFGELLVAPAAQQAESIKTRALHKNISLGRNNGLWVKEGSYYLNVKQIYPDNRMRKIEIYEFDTNKQLKAITRAESGIYKSKKWVLKDIKRSQFDSSSKVTTTIIKTETWEHLFNPDLFEVIAVQPSDMSATDLYKYSDYLENNQLDASHYRLAFWLKVITPLSTLVMLLIALPFVFGSLRSGSAGERLLVGIIIGIGYFIMGRIVNHIGQVYGLHPLLSAVLPMIIVLLYGLFAYSKIR